MRTRLSSESFENGSLLKWLARTASPVAVAVAASLGLATATGCASGRKDFASETAKSAVSDGARAQAKLFRQAGDEFFKRRDEKEQLRLAVANYEKAVELDPENDKNLARLSRAYYLLADSFYYFDWFDAKAKEEGAGGDVFGPVQAASVLITQTPEGTATITTLPADTVSSNAAEAKAKMSVYYEKGIAAAVRALTTRYPEFQKKLQEQGEDSYASWKAAVPLIDKDGQEALYWYASNLGKWATADGIAKALLLKDRIFLIMKHVKKLGKKFFFSGPDRYFGAYYATVPGGSLISSEEHFKKSLKNAPNYLGTKVLWAERLSVKKQSPKEFRALLEEVVAATPEDLPEAAPENRIEQGKAKRLLARIDELF
jgi:tetratricopeptide (TPR) repeat protein